MAAPTRVRNASAPPRHSSSSPAARSSIPTQACRSPRAVLTRRTALMLVSGAVLAASTLGAILCSRAADWRPLSLLVLLLCLAIASDLVIVEIRSLRLSGAFLALVLAMALLGPAPAAALGAVSAAIEAVVS